MCVLFRGGPRAHIIRALVRNADCFGFFKLSNVLQGRVTERRRDRELLFTGLFPKWLQQSGLGQAQVCSQTLQVALLQGGGEPSFRFIFPGTLAGRWTGS